MGETYNDVKRATNETTTEYAYALTTKKGRTCKDRANDTYYNEIAQYKHATFIKLYDRYANMKYSKDIESLMYKTYVLEMDSFSQYLKGNIYNDLWIAVEELSKNKLI